MADVMIKECSSNLYPGSLFFRQKVRLSNLASSKICRQLNTLGQKQFLVGEAANYLDIKGLLDVTCKTVANIIKGKSPEEIRKTFTLKTDFTPEEEEQVRIENELCEEK